MDLLEFARAAAALAVTLGLVGGAAYLARRFGPSSLFRIKGGAERRMAVVESLMLDPQRRLVLVKLDGSEHLLLLGEGRLLNTRDAPAATATEPSR